MLPDEVRSRARHRASILIAAGVLLLVLRVVAQTRLPLMHQEAYYWMYAQHPSLSYYDHPPMVAWTIRLGTMLFGNDEWGVRAVGGLLMLLNGWLMYRFARFWWGRTVAVASAVLVEVLPVYFGIGFLATMDSALLMFWLIGLIGFSLAVRRGRTWGWYLCGFGLGGALLSKYTGVFVAPGVALSLLVHGPWRKHLRSPHPYLGLVLGVLMFGPVLAWNYEHDWASFRFQFLSRIDSGETAHRHPLLEFLGLQVGVATPLILGSFVLVAWRGWKRRRLSGREVMALAFSVPLLLSVTHKAWAYPIHINWTAPAYLAFMPAAVQAARVRVRAGLVWPKWLWRAGVVTPTVSACMAVNLALMFFLIAVQPRTHSMRAFGPWDDLAAEVERCEDNLEQKTGRNVFVVVDGKYELASLMAFYRNRIAAEDRPAVSTVNQVVLGDTALGFAYWTDVKLLRGMDCVFVDEDVDTSRRLAGRFKSVEIVWTGRTDNGRRYSIAECRGYLG